MADLLVGGVKQCRDLESFLPEAGVIGQGQAEVAGAHDGHAQVAVETQDLPQVPPQFLYVVADAAHAEFAEVGEVFADLGGVEVKLLRERLGGDCLDAGRIEFVEAAQVDRQPIGRQFRDLIRRLSPLVRPIHKVQCYRKVEWTVALRAAALAALVLLVGQIADAQPATRRLTTIAALRQFPGFYHLQNITLRGEFTDDGTRIMLRADEHDIRVVLGDGVRTTSGPVELRGYLIDVGRLEPADPRVTAVAAGRDTERWPRPGEELFVQATNVMPAAPVTGLTVRALALEPWRYEGQNVTVIGNFRGRNLFGDLPGAPGTERYEFVIRGAEGAIWVTGLRPRGRGFEFEIDRRIDTDKWLEVTGTVVHERGLVSIAATALAVAEAPAVTETSEEPDEPPPPPPPLEVVFSSPTDGEIDVAPGAPVRIQFSRGLNPKTVEGAIRVSYAGAAPKVAPPAFETTYDAASRALTLRFSEPLERFRTVRVEVTDTLRAFDGGIAQPWVVTFTVG